MTDEGSELWMLLKQDDPDEHEILNFIKDQPTSCSYHHIEVHEGDDGSLVEVFIFPICYAMMRSFSMDIIRMILECYPEYVTTKNAQESLFLHELLENNIYSKISSDMIYLVIEANKEAVKTKDKLGNLPLHIECSKCCRLEIIMKLCEMYPEGLTSMNDMEQLPLHCFMSNSGLVQCVVCLIELYPDSVRTKDSDGDLPLHLICKNKSCQHEIVTALLNAYPEAVMMVGSHMHLPLHNIINNECSSMITTSHLMSLYPEAARMMDDNGRYALHMECVGCRRYDIIIALFDIYPDAISIADHVGNLPLHSAMCNRTSRFVPSIVYFLIDHYPESVCMMNNKNEYPLHLACEEYDIDLIKLFHQYPEAARSSSINDELPLHVLLQNYEVKNPEPILHFVKEYPDIVSICYEGDLPIHIECTYQCRLDVIADLLDIYPEAISSSNPNHDLPLHIALRSDCKHEVIIYLIQRYPAAARMQCDGGNVPLHLIWITQHNYEAFMMLYDIYPEAISIMNDIGNLPIYDSIIQARYSSIDMLSFMLRAYPAAAFQLLTDYNHDQVTPFSTLFMEYYHIYVHKTYDLSILGSRRYQYHKFAVELLDLYPQALYLPSSKPYIDSDVIRQDPLRYRLLLNIASHHLTSSHHIHDYHDMNYKARSTLIHLIHQLSCNRPHKLSISSIARSRYPIDVMYQYHLLQQLMMLAGRSIDTNPDLHLKTTDEDTHHHYQLVSYGWLNGDDLGQHLIRYVVGYL